MRGVAGLSWGMPAYVHAIATHVPETAYAQDEVLDVMRRTLPLDRRTERLLGRVYGHSGIDTRHSVVRDFRRDPDADGHVPPLFTEIDGTPRVPSTAERNAHYAREAAHGFPATARMALDAVDGVDAGDVTHVITVSCTGFYAPGPDLDVVRGLGLGPTTERYHLGFMGCYAAFPALRMARAFCLADPTAVVLIVALEACTLHLQPSIDPDAVIAASVFADGAAAVLVTAEPPSNGGLRLDGFVDGLAPEGAGDMAWTIGDTGFEMVLSSYVPAIVGEKAHAALDPLLAPDGRSLDDVDHWAVHPGGRAIVDAVEGGLRLPSTSMRRSRSVLARYGNMSSATVLFVLADLLRERREAPSEVQDVPQVGDLVVAMAFGPGLTVASGRFQVV